MANPKERYQFVVWSSADEVIITIKKNRDEAFQMWFTEGGRDPDAYDEQEIEDVAIEIRAGLKLH